MCVHNGVENCTYNNMLLLLPKTIICHCVCCYSPSPVLLKCRAQVQGKSSYTIVLQCSAHNIQLQQHNNMRLSTGEVHIDLVCQLEKYRTKCTIGVETGKVSHQVHNWGRNCLEAYYSADLTVLAGSICSCLPARIGSQTHHMNARVQLLHTSSCFLPHHVRAQSKIQSASLLLNTAQWSSRRNATQQLL
jgi:hypothetical protein